MGITTSSDYGIKQARACILGDVLTYSVENSGVEAFKKECEAIFGPKPEEKFVDRETEAFKRLDDLLRGGPCKEAYKARQDCVDEEGYGSNKCDELAVKLYYSMCSHPDYYQPVLAALKAMEVHVWKEHDAHVAKKQALRDDALAARKQAFRDELRRFR